MCSTKALKATRNLESESKTKKLKQAAVCETKESECSKEHLPDSQTTAGKSTRKQRRNLTNISQKTNHKKSKVPATAKSKGKAQIKTEKPKVSVKLSNRTRKFKGIINEIVDTGKSEKKGFVQQVDSKLEKAELVEEANKRVSQKARKKSAPKLFRKKA